jgi:hypothetical protein
MSIFDTNEFDSGAEEVLAEIEQQEAQIVEDQQRADEVLTEAIKRIEEANLWKLLISQDVFETGSARHEILQSANRRIKQFATQNLEILVGIRQEKTEQSVQIQALPFDKEEIQALKVLLAKILKKDVAPQNEPPVPTIKRGLAAPTADITEVAGPQLKRLQSSVKAQPQAPQVSKTAPKKRQNGKGKLPGGQAKPSSGKIKPTTMNGMALMQAGVIGGKPAMSVSGDGAAGSGNLMQQVMNNLLPQGGSMVELGTENVDTGDTNDRF